MLRLKPLIVSPSPHPSPLRGEGEESRAIVRTLKIWTAAAGEEVMRAYKICLVLIAIGIPVGAHAQNAESVVKFPE
jgi:hypothetical protein